MKSFIHGFLNNDELSRISLAIENAEKKTSGEIVVSIKGKRGLFQTGKTIRQLAEAEFKRLRMGNTRDKTGILLYIVYKSREFIVLADIGIHSITGESAWENLRDLIKDHFKKGEFSGGIISAVNQMGEILTLHFPILPGDTNELSNKVIIRL